VNEALNGVGGVDCRSAALKPLRIARLVDHLRILIPVPDHYGWREKKTLFCESGDYLIWCGTFFAGSACRTLPLCFALLCFALLCLALPLFSLDLFIVQHQLGVGSVRARH
jgi:hypothetical protein